MQGLSLYSWDFPVGGHGRRGDITHSVKCSVWGVLEAGIWEGILVRRCTGRVLSVEGEWKKGWGKSKSTWGCGFSQNLVSDWTYGSPWDVSFTTKLVASSILGGYTYPPRWEHFHLEKGGVWATARQHSSLWGLILYQVNESPKAPTTLLIHHLSIPHFLPLFISFPNLSSFSLHSSFATYLAPLSQSLFFLPRHLNLPSPLLTQNRYSILLSFLCILIQPP